MTNFSNKWFASDERVMAVTFMFSIANLGFGIGYIYPSFFVNDNNDYEFKNGILMLFISQSALVGISFLICIILFKDKPEYPPSPAALI